MYFSKFHFSNSPGSSNLAIISLCFAIGNMSFGENLNPFFAYLCILSYKGFFLPDSKYLGTPYFPDMSLTFFWIPSIFLKASSGRSNVSIIFCCCLSVSGSHLVVALNSQSLRRARFKIFALSKSPSSVKTDEVYFLGSCLFNNDAYLLRVVI